MTDINIHTDAEIDAMVEQLREQLPELIDCGFVRSWCIESDLRVVAYNSLTLQKIDALEG